MKCSVCDAKFSKRDVSEVKRRTFFSSIKCPHCSTWLRSDPKSVVVQNIGGLLMLLGGLGLKYIELDNPGMLWAGLVAGGVVLAIGVVISKLIPCEIYNET